MSYVHICSISGNECCDRACKMRCKLPDEQARSATRTAAALSLTARREGVDRSVVERAEHARRCLEICSADRIGAMLLFSSEENTLTTPPPVAGDAVDRAKAALQEIADTNHGSPLDRNRTMKSIARAALAALSGTASAALEPPAGREGVGGAPRCVLSNRVTGSPQIGDCLWLVSAEWLGGHDRRRIRVDNVHYDEASATKDWTRLTAENHNKIYGRSADYNSGFVRHPLRIFATRPPVADDAVERAFTDTDVERVARASYERRQEILWEGGIAPTSWGWAGASVWALEQDCARAAIAALSRTGEIEALQHDNNRLRTALNDHVTAELMREQTDMVLVPREPTEAMRAAYNEAVLAGGVWDAIDVSDFWSAIITAASKGEPG